MSPQAALMTGLVIPAHPLALTADRKLDERRQRALSRYYLDAGAGGLAVAVHTTQFAIHNPKSGLLRPVLALAAETAFEGGRGVSPVLVAGVCGRTKQAVAEAELAASLGYHAGLLQLAGFRDSTEAEVLAHCRAVAKTIPLFGFYLQPAVGGRPLSYGFWREFAEIEAVVAIKIAPFNRYDTFNVVRAVAEAGRGQSIALYTGNDDNIVSDLLAPYRIAIGPAQANLRIVGGLLGHWAVWTAKAVDLLHEIKQVVDHDQPVPAEILQTGNQITDVNAAIFDVANGFAGVIPGVHEILRRQGLMAGRWCLDPAEDLSPGQIEEIDRVCASYPHLADDAFVQENLDRWLS